ncbi:hypothetical protein MLD38_031054 [Melastoma candidum]|uniref:Uncharacterized protein n=1 Tax=Melastoma candidum TaxID=119954 RepID=A0ACB9MN60_9MYRT|nr:hypothetical protein MLD38_031054 [Melastoma candidum]
MGKWRKVAASRGGPSFSHLFFADDLLIFGEATMKNARAIKRALQEFCDLSGQQVNNNKSHNLFSPNVNSRFSRKIASETGCKIIENLGKYLGFPLRTGRVNDNAFNSVTERVRKKLAGWQTKFLSKVARVVVIKSVAEAIPAYLMSCLKWPRKALELDRINRNFLRGSTEENKKLHLLNWHQVTKRKEEGGLGLFRAKDINTALLSGLAWRLRLEQNTQWGQVIIHKYGKQLEKRKQGLCILKALKLGEDLLNQGTKMNVHNRGQTRFWKGRNLRGCSIKVDLETTNPPQAEDFRMAHLVRKTSDKRLAPH